MKNLTIAFAAVALSVTVSAQAANIKWIDTDGGSSTLAGTWANLQTAITNAQAGSGASAGQVLINGNITRSLGTESDLLVGAGNVQIFGGYDAAFATRSGRSIVNADYGTLGTNSRVFQLDGSAGVLLDGLEITGGRTTAQGGGVYILNNASGVTLNDVKVSGNSDHSGYFDGGGGVAILNSSGVRISHSEVSGNTAANRGWGGGLWIEASGSVASPVIIEHSTISDNLSTLSSFDGNGGAIAFSGDVQALIANSRIVNNVAAGNGTAIAWAGSNDNTNVTIFGSLISGNRGPDGDESGKDTVILSGGRTSQRGAVIANSTIVDNHGGGVVSVPGFYWKAPQEHEILALLNAVLDEDRVAVGYSQDHSHSWQGRSYATFQNTTLSLADTDAYIAHDYDGSSVAEHLAGSLAAALALLDDHSNNRFHGMNALGTRTQNAEQNLEENPLYVGSGGDPWALQTSDNSVDSGILQLASHAEIVEDPSDSEPYIGLFAYVDIDADLAYSPTVDVIVDLFGGKVSDTAGSIHYVYDVDLLGADRLQGSAIDRGEYETSAAAVPEPATLALLGLGGLALAGVRGRRGRRGFQAASAL